MWAGEGGGGERGGGGGIPHHATTARVSKGRSHNCDGDPGKRFRSPPHLCLEGLPYRVYPTGRGREEDGRGVGKGGELLWPSRVRRTCFTV